MRTLLACSIVSLSCVLARAAMPPLPAAVKNMAPNPSFEKGATAPAGWTRGATGTWAVATARSGSRSLAASAGPSPAWKSDRIRVVGGWSYRLTGWIDSRSGAAILGMDFLDTAGSVVGTVRAPSPSISSGWRYTAVEADMPRQCTDVRLWLRTSGEAFLDDVVLVPTTVNLVYNPTFEPGSKGRVTFWDPAPRDAGEGIQTGKLSVAPDGGRSGSALKVSAVGGWQGARNLDTALPDGIDVFQFEGWAKPLSGESSVTVGWLNPRGQLIRSDKIAARGSDGGWLHFQETVRRPGGSALLRLVALARGGESLYDDFALYPDAPVRNGQPVVKVLVNQVGYESRGPKSVVVATSFFPRDCAEGSLDIVSAAGNQVAHMPLRCSGRIYEGNPNDWGHYYWRGDFTPLAKPGKYRVVATIGGAKGESPEFEIGERILLERIAKVGVDFFFVQRCGYEVPGWHKACHLDDANLPDGKHIDATGGWHSAGDYNKLMYENGDGGVAYALVKAFEAAPGIFSQYDRNGDGLADALDEALWGAAFVAKMQHPETGGLYKDIRQGPRRNWMKWCPPDLHTDNVVGTPDDPVIDPGEGHSPLVIGAWANLATRLNQRGVRNDYLDRAVKLFKHAVPAGEPTSSPHLLLSGMELYKATAEQRYLEFVRGSARKILDSQSREGRMKGAFGGYGQWEAAALAVFALSHRQDPLVPQIRKALADYTTFCLTTADNPFGLSKESVGEKEYFFHPSANMGVNFLYLGRAWAAGLVYRLNGDARAIGFAADQVDWVMGKNPFALCLVEGVGTNNPHWYHHRYDSIPGHERGAVPGAVPNGFVVNLSGLDVPGFDMTYPGTGQRDHPSYRTSEPWLVHNMHLLLALIGVSSTTSF